MASPQVAPWPLNHSTPGGSFSKLRVKITVENLDGSKRGFNAEFICYEGDVLVTTEEEEPNLLAAAPHFSPQRTHLVLNFKDLQMHEPGSRLTFTYDESDVGG